MDVLKRKRKFVTFFNYILQCPGGQGDGNGGTKKSFIQQLPGGQNDGNGGGKKLTEFKDEIGDLIKKVTVMTFIDWLVRDL